MIALGKASAVCSSKAGEEGFAMFGFGTPVRMVTAEEALPGRAEPMPVPERHVVLGHSLAPPFPPGMRRALFGLGCFWGAEQGFWQMDGV